jgi:WD40 repeat protein
LAFSTDGTRLATGAADGKVRVFGLPLEPDPARLALGEVRRASVAQTGRAALLQKAGLTVRDWNGAPAPLRLGGRSRFAIAAGGERLATSEDSTVRVWDVSTGQQQFSGTLSYQITAMALAPDGMAVAAGSADGTVRWWDLRSQREIVMPGARALPTALAFSPDAHLLAVSAEGPGTHIWDLAAGAGRVHIAGESAETLAFCADGSRLVLARGRRVRVCEASRGAVLTVLELPGVPTALCLSPEGNTLAAAWADEPRVRLWRVDAGREVGSVGPCGTVLALQFVEGGTHLQGVDSRLGILRWASHTSELISRIQSSSNACRPGRRS